MTIILLLCNAWAMSRHLGDLEQCTVCAYLHAEPFLCLCLTSIIPSAAAAGATAEVNLVWFFGTELGSSSYTIEFMTKVSLWCHRQRSPLS